MKNFQTVRRGHLIKLWIDTFVPPPIFHFFLFNDTGYDVHLIITLFLLFSPSLRGVFSRHTSLIDFYFVYLLLDNNHQLYDFRTRIWKWRGKGTGRGTMGG